MVRSCRARVVILTLVFATSGLLLELLILFLIGFARARPDFLPHFLTSVAGLYIGALLLGAVVMEVVCAGQLSKIRLNLVGLAVGWLTLFVKVSFGVSLEFSRNSHQSGAFGDYVFKPVFWVILFGAIPATILGLIYAKRLERLLK